MDLIGCFIGQCFKDEVNFNARKKIVNKDLLLFF